MIAFEFTRIDESLFANEFDQGDISLISENLCITSKLNSKHSNMIYLSIISLIDGLTRNNKYFEFIATDSSFRIKFKQQRETILINHEGILKIKVNRFELLKALEDGAERFLTVSPAEARTSFLALDQYLRSITSGFQPTAPTHYRHEQIFILLASALIAGVAALFASAAAGRHLEGAHYLA